MLMGSPSRRLQQGIWMDPLFNRRSREPIILLGRVEEMEDSRCPRAGPEVQCLVAVLVDVDNSGPAQLPAGARAVAGRSTVRSESVDGPRLSGFVVQRFFQKPGCRFGCATA